MCRGGLNLVQHRHRVTVDHLGQLANSAAAQAGLGTRHRSGEDGLTRDPHVAAVGAGTPGTALRGQARRALFFLRRHDAHSVSVRGGHARTSSDTSLTAIMRWRRRSSLRPARRASQVSGRAWPTSCRTNGGIVLETGRPLASGEVAIALTAGGGAASMPRWNGGKPSQRCSSCWRPPPAPGQVRSRWRTRGTSNAGAVSAPTGAGAWEDRLHVTRRSDTRLTIASLHGLVAASGLPAQGEGPSGHRRRARRLRHRRPPVRASATSGARSTQCERTPTARSYCQKSASTDSKRSLTRLARRAPPGFASPRWTSPAGSDPDPGERSPLRASGTCASRSAAVDPSGSHPTPAR